MASAMTREKYEKIEKHIHVLKTIDVENGIVETKRGKNGWKNPNGYLLVDLLYTKVLVHQVIAFMLWGEDCIGKQVDHIDRNRLNNRADNLRLVTHLENQKNKIDSVQTPIKAMNIDTGEVFVFESQQEASRKLGVHAGDINKIINRHIKRWTFERVIEENEVLV